MKVFENDTVRLTLNTGIDVSTCTTFMIKYEDPDGDRGRWVAILSPSNNNHIRADVIFSQDGVWRVQAYVSKIGEIYHGMYADVRVYQALSTTTTLAPTTMVPTT